MDPLGELHPKPKILANMGKRERQTDEGEEDYVKLFVESC
jgi:hypothetical protein